MAEKTIVTSKCDTCKHGNIDYNNKPKMPIWCAIRQRYYVFGQRIPCDDYAKETGETNNE